jgi:hypothetical protein
VVTITATDLASTTAASFGHYSAHYFGSGGVASVGKAHNFTADSIVQGCGDANSEYCPYYAWQNVQIGTGFTQSTGPAGKLWLTDFKQQGPIAVQPEFFNGVTVLQTQHYNGAPANQPGYGLAIVTKFGIGDAQHAAAETFAIADGIFVGGFSSPNGSTVNVGYTTGIRLGGTGSGWGVTDSKFATGIDVRSYTTYGIKVDKYTGTTPSASIYVAAGAGPALFGAATTGVTTTLLEVRPSGAANPAMRIGDGSLAAAFTLSIQNSSGVSKFGQSAGANNFLTGSAAGDLCVYTETDTKKILVGGTGQAPVVAVKHNNAAAGEVGFFSATTAAKQTVTGSRGANAALASLLTALAAYGLLTDSSTA